MARGLLVEAGKAIKKRELGGTGGEEDPGRRQ